MTFTAIFCLALIAAAAAQTQPIPFDSAPLCESVWNPAAPPAAAVPTVLQTVGYLDSVGHFSGSPGQAVLGGTVPWSAYIQVAMAVSFGALDPDTQTPAQEQCLAIFDHALGNTNDFTPVLVSDMTSAANPANHWESFPRYLSSIVFTERRLCPCFNMLPRELVENMNCRSGESDTSTLSAQFLTCQAIDTAPIYASVNYNNTLQMEMPLNRDVSRIENWQGCVDPGMNVFALQGFYPYHQGGDIRYNVYQTAIATHNLGSGSSFVPPSSVQPSAVQWEWTLTSPLSFLDDVAGTCFTNPVNNNPTGRYGQPTGEGGGKGGSESGSKGMGGSESGSKGMGGSESGGKGKGSGGSESGGKGKGSGGSESGGKGGRLGYSAQMTASFASKVTTPQGVGAMVGVVALVAGTAFVSVRRARLRAVDVESQSDETTALVSVDSTPAPTII